VSVTSSSTHVGDAIATYENERAKITLRKWQSSETKQAITRLRSLLDDELELERAVVWLLGHHTTPSPKYGRCLGVLPPRP
jgi:hypothetical protein